jgi:hypothetical protein
VADIDINQLRQSLAESGARWSAGETAITRLPDGERRRRLGVTLDEGRLAELRQRPAPDLARIVAESAVAPQVENREAAVERTAETVASAMALRARASELVSVARFPFWWFLYVDWRSRFGLDAVTSVKDQGGCGSCVSFGTIATLESMLLIERNLSTDLSEAELLFCGGGGCGGWWPDSAVTYLSNRGVSQESCFPYHPWDMPCTPCARRDGEAIKITSSTVMFNTAQRKDYLAWAGPTMCVFSVYSDFYGYTSGVYSHVAGGFEGLHCVEVIGYDDFEGCWICKNSWGSGWGDGGFFRIAYGQCDIDTTYPFWGISRTEFWT